MKSSRLRTGFVDRVCLEQAHTVVAGEHDASGDQSMLQSLARCDLSTYVHTIDQTSASSTGFITEERRSSR